MADKKKGTNGDIKSDREIWEADHAKLVEASKLAQKAVFEHRNVPAEVRAAAEEEKAKAAGADK